MFNLNKQKSNLRYIKRKYEKEIINPIKKQKFGNKLTERNSYKDISNFSGKTEWLNAVENELNNMKRLNVYKSIRILFKNANLISSKWVFKYKRDSSGNIIQRKQDQQ